MPLELVNVEEECTGPDDACDEGASPNVSQAVAEDQPETICEKAGEDEPCDVDDCDEAVVSIHDGASSQVDTESAKKAEVDLADEDTPSDEDERPANLLEELDLQQNEVIAQLDELNDRIERLLGEWTQQRSDEKAA